MAAAALIFSTGIPLARGAAFEVASIHSVKGTGGPNREAFDVTPTGLNLRGVRLTSCVRWAYNVGDYQVSGPAWMSTERYDIQARTAAPVKEAELREMLQALLAERFKLQLHRESREMQVYSLVVAKNGHKLKASGSDGPLETKGPGGSMPARVPLARFAEFLSGPMQAPVMDRTGLAGVYDFTFDISRYFEIKPGENRPSQLTQADVAAAFITGLQEQLGLKLEAGREPVEVLVIDTGEKSPQEN